jgi:hypothetical protein
LRPQEQKKNGDGDCDEQSTPKRPIEKRKGGLERFKGTKRVETSEKGQAGIIECRIKG